LDVAKQREAAVDNVPPTEILVSPSVKLSSRINTKEKLWQMQNLLIPGGVIAIPLALVGLLNFMNWFSASIVRRKAEFAMLGRTSLIERLRGVECCGKRRMKKLNHRLHHGVLGM
jgi:hypothetical protein